MPNGQWKMDIADTRIMDYIYTYYTGILLKHKALNPE